MQALVRTTEMNINLRLKCGYTKGI